MYELACVALFVYLMFSHAFFFVYCYAVHADRNLGWMITEHALPLAGQGVESLRCITQSRQYSL